MEFKKENTLRCILHFFLWNAIHLESSKVECPSEGKCSKGMPCTRKGAVGGGDHYGNQPACLAWVFAYISSSAPARYQEKYVHFVEMALSSSLLGPSSGLCDPPHKSFPKQLGSAPGRKKNCTEVNKPAFQGEVPGAGQVNPLSCSLRHTLDLDFCPSRLFHH